MTPTTDAGWPLIRIVRFRIPGSAPKRLCQSRLLMMAALGPFGASSSRVKPRPSCGAMPMTGNRSSSSRAVNTRSATSPPEMFRLPRSKAAVVANDSIVRMSAYPQAKEPRRSRSPTTLSGNPRRQTAAGPAAGRETDAARSHPQAVDEAVAADPDGEREHHDRGEAWPAADLAKGIPHVLKNGIHFAPLGMGLSLEVGADSFTPQKSPAPRGPATRSS